MNKIKLLQIGGGAGFLLTIIFIKFFTGKKDKGEEIEEIEQEQPKKLSASEMGRLGGLKKAQNRAKKKELEKQAQAEKALNIKPYTDQPDLEKHGS